MRMKILLLAALACVVFLAAGPSLALAAVPANDNIASATTIDPSTLPFNTSVVIDDATLESGEPGCYLTGKSVWYQITPSSSGIIKADISGSSFFDRFLWVYRQDGTGLGGLNLIACASPYYNGASTTTFNVQAGKTYYLQAGGVFSSSTGTLSLSVQAIPPPANDNFANATAITAVPFTDGPDLTGATTETNEPTPSCGGAPSGSVWYAFTPPSTGSYTMDATANSGFGFVIEYAAYTGSSLGSLSGAACHYGNPFTFHATPGTPVYIQVANAGGLGQPIQIHLDVAPQPVPSLGYYPSDPSIFDTVHFFDNSYDPAGAGVQSEAWNFGDGTTSTGCCPTHVYRADGNYTVGLQITTTDGRTASTSQIVQVRTHDVSIKKLAVPTAAGVGQTRQITVGLSDTRYPETVQVQLFRSNTSGGFDPVGSLTNAVPVTGGKSTNSFVFSYTFTASDAAVGKVTFEAIATIQGARDALPADNTAVAPPTAVH